MNAASVRMASSMALLAALVGSLVVSLQVGEGRSSGGATRRRHPTAPPFVLFRTLAPPEAHGHVALLRLDPPEGPRLLTTLSCLRVHYAAGGGVCVVNETVKTVSMHAAYAFDGTLARGRRIALAGVPTRVRVAPNGRHAAITTYQEEETPEGERLAIDSIVVDLRTGRTLADLRQFRLDNDGLPPIARPIDVSSVAFERDSDRFFAAVASSSEHYLVAGSISERRMTAIRTGVASESLSPDGQQLVVKKMGEHGFWRLAVIDLRTWHERQLVHERSVDDQVEWLDNDHVLYHDADENSSSLWMLPVDGVNGPRLFVRDAVSGVVQR
jgi:hypothetical protein